MSERTSQAGQTHLNYTCSQPRLRINEKISISVLIYFPRLNAIAKIFVNK
ncbi:hypothetical protein GXM_07401 [Nostoc sphaeroides CCNUC1]|uniref:Uncharacterized protein n=1 Tax=Nostoc sphaeroides CCNUC1 TaxID=2653204 RepID=A0A5P8WAU0_9NOSO|nr:hypothetical protein GXM_07401 [Nostoc sphaeroides CCNUC1]